MPDGAPHVTPVWVDYDGKKLRGKDWVRKIESSRRSGTVPESFAHVDALSA